MQELDEDDIVLRPRAIPAAGYPVLAGASPAGATGPAVQKKKPGNSQPCGGIRNCWVSICYVVTCCLPPFLLRWCFKNPQVEIAFREKLVLNLIILLISGLFFFLIVGLGLILCPNRNVLSAYEVNALSTPSYPLVTAYGNWYLIKDVYDNHVNQAAYISAGAFKAIVLGRDVSAMFVKVWTIHSSQQPSGSSTSAKKNYLEMIKKDLKGPMARDKQWIQSFLLADPISNYMLVAYGRVYDVSKYLDTVSTPDFLGPNVKQIILKAGRTGQDATALLDQIKTLEGTTKWTQYMNCMDAMFFVGVVDQRQTFGCIATSYLVLCASIFIVVVIGFKFIAALQFNTTGVPQPPSRYVLVVVPCYNEGNESLRTTFESIANTDYSSSMKVLVVVVDGVVKGVGNDKYTSDIVLEVLGNTSSDPPTRMYHSLGNGNLQLNMAKVYSGLYHHHGHQMPYIVVVKTGELSNNGNRGKRDSQLILMGFLSRLHMQKPLCPLDLEIQYHFLYKVGVDARNFEFLLYLDGDTEIATDSISLLVSSMENHQGISAICGETVLRNPSQSWVTMIQVYEYWITHNLSKSFESLFGSVTCLPGCFCMYRIFNSADMTPVLISERMVQEYGLRKVDTLHLKNLLSLGEDRYLTTLILKTFPEMRTKYISNAIAETSAPSLWSVLLSQRRRWINSTVHNLMELAILSELKGLIRFVVLVDLFSTILSPIGFVYFIYLFVVLLTEETISVPLVSILLLCSIYGLQILLFVLKAQFANIGWMILYLLAMPVFAFTLPLYSFWHFDDFAWGSTRLVTLDETSEFDLVVNRNNFDEFDISMIPHKTWKEYEEGGGLSRRIQLDYKTSAETRPEKVVASMC
ncbi:hypothetical protein HDU91_005652 [Kappamyces sp. JEL0680]|nr:hypothetical protein HDU91_005652 [Kappamyces sp. JEL0680]